MTSVEEYRRQMLRRLDDEAMWACQYQDMSVSQYVTWLLDIVGEHVGSLPGCTVDNTTMRSLAKRSGGSDATTP